jgi:hypothetical protein
VLQTNGGDQHILDANVFVTANQPVVKVSSATGGCPVQGKNVQHPQQFLLPDLPLRPGDPEENFVHRHRCYGATVFLDGLGDHRRRWLTPFQKGDQRAGV